MTDDAPLGPETYQALRRIAAARMRGRQAVTLQPTALVHEAWAKIGAGRAGIERGHFLALAARAMRQVIIDRARARQAAKRGGGRVQVTLASTPGDAGEGLVDVLAVDEALTRLAELDPRRARVVELRFFGGMSTAEIAEAMGQSTATVERDWRAARAWLQVHLAAEALSG
ncbi:MAG: sigma-70 family RNA polymerase sigma factor [Myxococcales bacterium]|nr:sigma-70 family RNA polymerase sigma factor [Myxococcales bacterium]